MTRVAGAQTMVAGVAFTRAGLATAPPGTNTGTRAMTKRMRVESARRAI
jgi:hypothetical protein